MENLHRLDLAVRQESPVGYSFNPRRIVYESAAGFLKLGIITAWNDLKMLFPAL